jgi:hypothetical protein
VPTVLVSPWIEEGTVYRVQAGSMPLDHTSILRTVEQRWKLPALTKRDCPSRGRQIGSAAIGAVESIRRQSPCAPWTVES